VPKRVIIVLVIVVAFGGLMFSSMVRSCSPHVGFEKAKSGDRVQVYGSIMSDKIVFDSTDLSLSFTLENDAGEILPVVYKGVVPSNFEYAQEATCAGVWEGDRFECDQLLLKCPSKYEGEIEDGSQIEFYNEDKDI
jgi:cytochrome c-type biogenesis protein CcmE